MGLRRVPARYDDVETSRQLLQLVRRALGACVPDEEVWEHGGRWYDPCRPMIQPNGFASRTELAADRRQHLAAVRRALTELDVMVVSLGATSCWASSRDGAVVSGYPKSIPGAIDPARYQRVHLSIDVVVEEIATVLDELRVRNPRTRMVLTTPAAVDAQSAERRAEAEVLASAAIRLAERYGVVDLGRARTSLGEPDPELLARLIGDEPAGRRLDEDRSDPAHIARGDSEFRNGVRQLTDALCDERAPQDGIKCVVWDLDDTVWHGTRLEGDQPVLREGVRDLLEALDRRGVLSSIASRGDRTLALTGLEALGIRKFFLHPQIAWCSKAESIVTIARLLNISLENVAFVDDQPFEREEVCFSLPEVRAIDAALVPSATALSLFRPKFVTDDARARRRMYVQDQEREAARRAFSGTAEAFLATLDLSVAFRPATAGDLDRVEELLARTHQFNSTGRIYTRHELEHHCASTDRLVLLASLSDRFGSYGTVAVAIATCAADIWTIDVVLVSCRVISRGTGDLFLSHLLHLAAAAGVRLRARLIPTERNQPVQLALASAGFTRILGGNAASTLVEAPRGHVRPWPRVHRSLRHACNGYALRAPPALSTLWPDIVAVV